MISEHHLLYLPLLDKINVQSSNRPLSPYCQALSPNPLWPIPKVKLKFGLWFVFMSWFHMISKSWFINCSGCLSLLMAAWAWHSLRPVSRGEPSPGSREKVKRCLAATACASAAGSDPAISLGSYFYFFISTTATSSGLPGLDPGYSWGAWQWLYIVSGPSFDTLTVMSCEPVDN